MNARSGFKQKKEDQRSKNSVLESRVQVTDPIGAGSLRGKNDRSEKVGNRDEIFPNLR
jgi:hypothetical protein